MRLYHYCSLTTFSAIVENNCLRLSDISKSNDSEELRYSVPIIEKAFEDAFVAEKAKYFKSRVDWNLFQRVVKSWLMRKLCRTDNVCYAICFSQCADLLSQWRGYANDATGVSFGVEKNEILLEKLSEIKLKQVIYDKRRQKGGARKIADNVVADIKKKAKIMTIDEGDINDSLNKFLNEFLDIMAYYKSPFFKEEKEWRLYVYAGTTSLTENYLFTEDNCKKYIDIKLDSLLKSAFTLKVILGPKCKADKNDISSYLDLKSILNDVVKSEGSYIGG